MKNLTTFVSAILLVFSTTACSQYRHTEHTGTFGGKTVKASKNYVTKNIKVDNFTGLNLAGSPDVIYTQKAGKPEVEVYTSDNIVDLLDINVANNTLNIRFKKGVNVSFNKLEIRISSETLNSISIAGAGNIELANGLKTDHLKVSIAGAGDIQGSNITCTKLKNIHSRIRRFETQQHISHQHRSIHSRIGYGNTDGKDPGSQLSWLSCNSWGINLCNFPSMHTPLLIYTGRTSYLPLHEMKP